MRRFAANVLAINSLRALLTIFFVILFSQESKIQWKIDKFWAFLKCQWIFNSVYFETWYVTVLYTLLMLIPSTMSRLTWFDRFKIDSRTQFHHVSIPQIIEEFIIYMAPLATLDTFMVKWYAGVPEAPIRDRKRLWIQRTRALPEASPSLREILLHLIISLVIYDVIFFAVHVILHKNAFLYKKVHSEHHHHEEGLHGRITNQLTVSERIVLVLSANFSLKVIGAHPLTRVFYVPIFLWLLIENHWNYDFPCSYEKLVPFGLMGGSRYHHAHHCKGSESYQPFFTYLDSARRVLKSRKGLKTAHD